MLQEFLKPLGMTQTELAERMGLQHVQPVNLIINDRRAVTADTALLLARALKTSAEFWMNLQTHCDLWDARRKALGL